MTIVELQEKIRKDVINEIKCTLETAAKGHDDLAIKHPDGPFKYKAEALRRFSMVFL